MHRFARTQQHNFKLDSSRARARAHAGHQAMRSKEVEATSSLMCCHVEKRSRSEMLRRNHLLSNARAVSCCSNVQQQPTHERWEWKLCKQQKREGMRKKAR